MTDASTSKTDCCSPPRRRWQFSLLQLLGGVTAAAVWLAALKCSDNNPIVFFVGVLLVAWRINRRLFDNGWIAAAFTVAMTTNSCSMFAILPLLTVPAGSDIRPMMLAVIICALALLSLSIGVPLSVVGCFAGRGAHRFWGVLGIVLNLAVLPVGVLSMHLIAHVIGFTFAE
jgi:hypothetical protein